MALYSLDFLIASVNFFHPIIYILLSLFVQISTKYYVSKSSQHNHIPTRASASPLKQTHPHPPSPHPAPARKRIPSREQTSTPPRHLSQKTVRALVALVLINVPPRRLAPLIHRPVQIHPRPHQSTATWWYLRSATPLQMSWRFLRRKIGGSSDLQAGLRMRRRERTWTSSLRVASLM